MKHLGIIIVLVGAAVCLFFVTPVLGLGFLVIAIIVGFSKRVQGHNPK